MAGVPPDKVVEAHGSFASSRCIECKMPYDQDKMKLAISEARVARCDEEECDGLVKPDVIFFGESVSGCISPSSLPISHPRNLSIIYHMSYYNMKSDLCACLNTYARPKKTGPLILLTNNSCQNGSSRRSRLFVLLLS
jgi:NAD-dependent SIR2 family protein deacetylase